MTAKLNEALRAKIGEGRFYTWFATTGALLEARDDAVVVKVEEVYVHFLRNSYLTTLAEVAKEVLGAPLPIVFETTQNETFAPAPVSNSARPAVQQPTLLPFPPQKDARSNVFDGSPLIPEQPTEPPKRKRGRPRKNPAPSADGVRTVQTAPRTILPFAASGQDFVAPGAPASPVPVYPAISRPAPAYPVNLATPTPATFLPDALGSANYALGPAPQPSTDVAPPKRKRGRPRKNPAPTPTVPAAPPVVSFPFADAYNRSLMEAQSAAVPPTSSAVAQPAPTVDFSDDERAVVSLGSFADAPNFVEPPQETPQVTPRRRGRPKGSVNRVKPVAEDAQEDGVRRDSQGYNVSLIPQSRPQIKAEDGRQRQFASLKTFAVGPSNSTAHKMLDLVATAPGMMSPLYLYGPTSVGKTRLLEGVCDAFLHLPAAKTRPPLFMTADQFTTQFTSYVAGGVRPSEKFRDRFRNISLFALDDLQFLEGKKATQIELVKTLDSLRSLNVQVVLTGVRPLVDMPFLREELTTRIQSGLVAEIFPPERETLAAILRQVAADRHIVVPDDVCRYVVSRFATHAREVIGAVNRLYAMHLATGEPVTLDFAREALAGLAPVAPRNVRLEDVERVVQETFALEPNALKSSSRARKNADPRAVAMWLARKHTRAALAEIGAYFGGRRHSAVLSAQKKVEGWLQENTTLAGGDAPERPIADLLKSLERALTTDRR